MQKSKKGPSGKVKIGTVVSDRMNKTIVVRVSRLAVHPVFRKTIRRFNKLKAHDEKNSAKTGDTVRVQASRPISRDKRWTLVEIVEKAT